MNGEMLQACRLVAAAKLALQKKEGINYESLKYEKSIVFDFLPQKSFFGTKTYRASNVKEWFEKCQSYGLQDIKLLMPKTVKDRSLLGFSNTAQDSLVCFYKDGKVTYFTAGWDFDNTQKLWDITYTEHLWENAPQGRPSFADNTKEFAEVLEKIEILARDIDCDGFAEVFHSAGTILRDGVKDTSGIGISLPEKNYGLFMAASKADVFGAMGSWNDSPPYMAHEKGLEERYEELSEELLMQLRLAILYAVNEW